MSTAMGESRQVAAVVDEAIRKEAEKK